MKIIIIGGVAAGATAATRLKREMKDADITVFEKSSKISFSNCGLPYAFSGIATEDDLSSRSQTISGVDVRTLHEVTQINESEKSVEVRDLVKNETFKMNYDKLIVATGARGLDLPIEGLSDEKEVYSLRTWDEMQKINESLSNKKKAIVIGGGFAGIEVAENLKIRGMDVSLVEMAPKLAGFDFDMSSLIEDKIRENGINLYLEKTVDKIDSINKTANIGEYQVEYDIIITTGIKPNTELFKNTSIELDKKGLVETNENMQTSNPDIYAAGDITYTKHIVTGEKIYMPMARQANLQGRAAADHIANGIENRKFLTTGATGFTLFDEVFTKVGLSESATKFMGYPHRIVMATVASNPKYANSKMIVMKMIFRSDNYKLLGIQVAGNRAADIADVFATAITSGMTIYDLEKLNLVYQPFISTSSHPLNTIAQVAINEIRFGFSSECPYHVVFDEKEKNNLIIDVRSEEQHNVSHLKGAINIQTSDISIDTVGTDMERSIVVHCNSGFGASIAARKLTELGYKNVRNAFGGNNIYQAMMRKNKINK